MDLKSFNMALEQLEAERGISRAKIIETIEMALAAAYKKDYGKRGQIIKADFDIKSGKINFYQIKIAVDPDDLKEDSEMIYNEENESKDAETEKAEEKTENAAVKEEEETEERKIRFNPERHILLHEAKKIKKDITPNEEIVFPLEARYDYGRIAAQTAKQVILQNIREAEKDSLYEEFKTKEGQIASGVIQRMENYNIFLDLGRITAVLPKEEQVKNESYRIGERIKALVLSVQNTHKGLSIILSRTHPVFTAKLFEMEVPEILNGSVEIKGIAREPGSRSKIAVFSPREEVDPVGSCVGQRGVRVNTIINEMGGEKLDIIEWSENKEKFIENSLSPAKVLDVEIDENKHEAKIMVDENELSLAIGKNGQNVRLAAKLTGYKIDIKSRAGESVISASVAGEIESGEENIKEEEIN